MTSRELVKAAIAHKETDRIPYAIDLTQEAWDAVRTELGCAKEIGAGDFTDNDVLNVGLPWWGWYDLGPDWSMPDAPTSLAKVVGFGHYEGTRDQLKAQREKSDKYFLLTIYGSHFEKAYFARGIENFLADMAGEPEFARKFLNSIIEKNMVMLENVLSMPEIDGVLLGSDWGSQMSLLMSPATWEEMIRPGEKREYDLVHAYGKDVWVHSCGNVEAVIPSLVEIGLDVLNPVQPEAMDIAMLKRSYGSRLSFWGGLSTQRTLPFGTPDQVKEEARAVKRLMGAGGGYIFAPAQSIQTDVPVRNIVAMLDVARESSR